MDVQSVHHFLLHCSVVSSLWEIIFSLIGVYWVLPKTIKEALLNWTGSFVAKKRENLEVYPFVQFLDSLEGKNPYSF